VPRADEHPGLPRRPARHRHRRRRGRHQCAASSRARNFEDIKVVSTGGGAAGIACLNMLLKLGVKRENVWLCDIAGLVYKGRDRGDDPAKGRFRPRNPTCAR
jgi:malic enzyme